MHAAQLSVGVVWRAVAFPIVYPILVVRLGFIPFMLAALPTLILYNLWWPDGVDFRDTGNLRKAVSEGWSAIAAIYVINVLMMSVYAIRIHRMIVSGQKSGFFSVLFSWTMISYLGAIVIFAFMVSVARIVFGYGFSMLAEKLVYAFESFRTSGETNAPSLTWVVSAAAAIALLVLALQIAIRLLLILPHAALTGSIGLAASWRAMSGNIWTFVEAWVIFLIVTGLLILLFAFGALSLSSYISNAIAQYLEPFQISKISFHESMSAILFLIIYFMSATMNIAFLSFVYKDLEVDWTTSQPEVRYA
jgi:hypothetical protein